MITFSCGMSFLKGDFGSNANVVGVPEAWALRVMLMRSQLYEGGSLHVGSEEQSCVVEGHDGLLFSTDVGEFIIDYPEVEIGESTGKVNSCFHLLIVWARTTEGLGEKWVKRSRSPVCIG